MLPIPDCVLHYIYGLPPPTNGKRDQKTHMKVLAVGISRSGTESLREALHIIGFEHTHHGFDTILPPSSLQTIYRLLQKKYSRFENVKQIQKLTAEDFDAVLSDCVGVSDLFAAEFAVELITAYPDAKVILNIRKDLDGWYSSMEQTMGYFARNPVDWDWCKSWFSAELFWIRQTMSRTMMPRFFQGGFHSRGKLIYNEHVARIRSLNLPEHKLLEWSVEDGWEPLCKFLDRDVPTTTFPNGNPPKAWADRIANTMQKRHEKAIKNMIIFTSAVFVALVMLCSYISMG